MVFPGKCPFPLEKNVFDFLFGCNSLYMFDLVDLLCLDVNLFDFILYGICWSSWMFILMYFIKYGKLSHYFSKYSLFLLLEFPRSKPMLIYLMVSHSSLRLSFLQSVFFLFFPDSVHFIVTSSSLLIISFPSWNLPLHSSSEFFMSLFVLFFFFFFWEGNLSGLKIDTRQIIGRKKLICLPRGHIEMKPLKWQVRLLLYSFYTNRQLFLTS